MKVLNYLLGKIAVHIHDNVFFLNIKKNFFLTTGGLAGKGRSNGSRLLPIRPSERSHPFHPGTPKD